MKLSNVLCLHGFLLSRCDTTHPAKGKGGWGNSKVNVEKPHILFGIYKPDFAYAKAGVMLYDLRPQERQGYLLPMPEADPRRMALMAALDGINAKHGRGGLRFGAEGLAGQVWKMRQNNLSPRFTTEWDELATAWCK